jgi:hypothetical protein
MAANRLCLCARFDRDIDGRRILQSNACHNPYSQRERRRGVSNQHDSPYPTGEPSIFGRQWSIESLHRSLFRLESKELLSPASAVTPSEQMVVMGLTRLITQLASGRTNSKLETCLVSHHGRVTQFTVCEISSAVIATHHPNG